MEAVTETKDNDMLVRITSLIEEKIPLKTDRTGKVPTLKADDNPFTARRKWANKSEPNYDKVETDKLGSKIYTLNGKLHRTDGPAIEDANGYKAWYQHGKLHRTDGPAIERANGDEEWWQNGELHRTDGPAVEEAAGIKEWFQHDLRHRIDGPAVEWPNGSKEYWENGEFVKEAKS